MARRPMGVVCTMPAATFGATIWLFPITWPAARMALQASMRFPLAPDRLAEVRALPAVVARSLTRGPCILSGLVSLKTWRRADLVEMAARRLPSRGRGSGGRVATEEWPRVEPFIIKVVYRSRTPF